jgi:radical SAM-linked protein
MNRIVLESDIRRILLAVERPGRYVGGEFGTIKKDPAGLLRFVISYPDLYEIGMSNLAIRYLYQRLNAMDGVACERVFAPAMDFESELRAHQFLLYSLETGTPLREFDVIGFSVGYELTLTNLLNILDLGGIHPRREDRAESEPVVIAGGPAVTNPIPLGPFVDAVFIGEFEGVADELIPQLVTLKARRASRSDLIECLGRQPYVWTAEKRGIVRRTHWGGFGAADPTGATERIDSASFPVPNIKTVQDHGVVEIMRGCPNGCRFCHAGILYRPYRQKDPCRIAAETAEQVFRYGYREVTLFSLSSGDYPGLPAMVRSLTRTLEPYKVSFSLPSLRINSLTLDLMSELSAVRKSGLTFAVETPLEKGQRGLNKLAPLERTVELLAEAKERGWRGAKFYFMVGLPVSQQEDEADAILECLNRIRSRVRLGLNVNVSCFIPKPHTAFQWAAQLREQQALDRIMTIKRAVSGNGVTVRYHAPFLSLLEGILCRGDERAGELFHTAFTRGARFDSWEELVQRDLWRGVLSEADWDVEAETCRNRKPDEALPWDSINLGVGSAFLKREYDKALRGEMTSPCCPDCREMCGVCGAGSAPRVAQPVDPPDPQLAQALRPYDARQGRAGRILFSFNKQGPAAFLGHLDVMQIFERALLRAGYRSEFTQGYNPKPRIEFAQPLSLGIASEGEIALAEVQNFDSEALFSEALGRALPEGIRVTRVRFLPPHEVGRKKHSLMALFRASEYRIELSGQADETLLGRLAEKLEQRRTGELDNVKVLSRGSDNLALRVNQSGRGTANIHRILQNLGFAEADRSGLLITRTGLLADRFDSGESEVCSYFDLELK